MHDAGRPGHGITVVPRDPGVPRLGRALDPGTVGPRLAPLVGARGSLAVRVLKHTPPKRCVIGYEFEDGTRVVGKLYRKERAPLRAAVLAALGGALLGSARVPRLLACWEDLGLVLQEWAPGTRVADYAELGERSDCVLRLAAALADFHASPVRIGPAASLATQVRRTCRPGFEALASGLPELGDLLRHVEREMFERERALPGAPGPCHGDFGPRQVLDGGSCVWFVDLDGFCQGDPSLDVASFRVGLEAHLGDPGRALADRFLAAYLERRGIGALPTLVQHEVFCDLRRAVILWRKRPAGWQAEVRRTLQRGRSRL